MAETLMSLIENFIGPYYEPITFIFMVSVAFGLTKDLMLGSAICLVFSLALTIITGSVAFGYGAIAFAIIILALKLLGF